MLLRGRGYVDDGGRPSRLVGIGIDVTVQKRTEEKLRHTQRLEKGDQGQRLVPPAIDLPAVLAIVQASARAAHWTLDQYRVLVEFDKLLVAESEGKACGFLCARIAADEWEIENLVVATSFLRRGVADQLMRALIELAQTARAASILLEVRESNLPARRLYEKNAFQEVGRRRQYYRDPTEDAILYTLTLSL